MERKAVDIKQHYAVRLFKEDKIWEELLLSTNNAKMI